MVRYTKNKGTRPFRRKFPGFKDTNHLTSVLASLNNDQFKLLQRFAKHYLGDHIDGISTKSKNKVKPSSYKKIIDSSSSIALNLHVIAEDNNHNDPNSESHKGGGLGSAIQVVASTAWDQLKAQGIGGQAISWLEEKMLNPLHGQDLTQDDQENADLLIEAYLDKDKRAPKVHGWLHLPKYDSSYATVYYDPKLQDVHIAIRGSHSAHDWIHHNTKILVGQSGGKELVDTVRDYLMEISTDFPNHNLEVVSHSLSGTIMKDVILDASPEETKLLDNIDEMLFISPGSSPWPDQSSIRNIMADPRSKFFLNKSDIISQTFNQNITDDTRFVYGEPMSNPYEAHQYRQFTSGDSEYDKEVEWGDELTAPSPDSASIKWDVGSNTETLFDNLVKP